MRGSGEEGGRVRSGGRVRGWEPDVSNVIHFSCRKRASNVSK